MVSYGIAKARAKANRTDWNARTEITKAIITWADSEYEYELEIPNEDGMEDAEFAAWVEENAEDFAREDAEENGTTFEELIGIDYEEEYIDDDARFDADYDAYLDCQKLGEVGGNIPYQQINLLTKPFQRWNVYVTRRESIKYLW